MANAKRRLIENPNWQWGDHATPMTRWMFRALDKLGTIEEWHYIGDTGEPAFQSSWANVSGYRGACFLKDPQGWVHLSGLITGDIPGTTIFTLPEDYRPSAYEIHNVVTYDASATSVAAGWVDILPNGNINYGLYSQNVNAANDWLSLTGIRFRIN